VPVYTEAKEAFASRLLSQKEIAGKGRVKEKVWKERRMVVKKSLCKGGSDKKKYVVETIDNNIKR
jgi:hypothetical protein